MCFNYCKKCVWREENIGCWVLAYWHTIKSFIHILFQTRRSEAISVRLMHEWERERNSQPILINGAISTSLQRLLWNAAGVNVCHSSLVEFVTVKRTSIVFKHKNEMKVNYTVLRWSKQLCFIDKVLRRVSFQWMYKNHPLIILIWYIMTSSTSLFTVRGIHYCYCCWDLGQKYLCFQAKKQSKTTNWGLIL